MTTENRDENDIVMSMSFDQIRNIVGPDKIKNINENLFHIYGYEKLEYKLDKLKEALYHLDSQNLRARKILPFVKELLIDRVFIKYVLENIDKETMFHTTYEEIIVKKKVYFPKIENSFHVFALTWLFYLYH